MNVEPSTHHCRPKSRLRRRREDLGLTLRDISGWTGLSIMSLSRIERGTQALPEALLDRFAVAYRCEPGHMRWLAQDARRGGDGGRADLGVA